MFPGTLGKEQRECLLLIPLPLVTPSLTLVLNAHDKQSCNTQCGGRSFLVPPRALSRVCPEAVRACPVWSAPAGRSSRLLLLPPSSSSEAEATACLPEGCNRLISALPGELKEGTSPHPQAVLQGPLPPAASCKWRY